MSKRIHFLSLVLAGVTLVATAGMSSTAKAASISISTDVLNGGNAGAGNVASGTTSGSAEINYVNFIPNNANSAAVVYDNAGHTVNLAPNIYDGVGAAARGASQGIQVNTYGPIAGSNPTSDTNMFLAGQPNANNPGFGAHANWVVTVNLDTIRTDHSLTNQTLDLSGLFGAWGAIGDSSGGVIQGEIFLDGTRIDSMPLSSFTPANDPSFNLLIPSTAHELSFFILNSPTSSLWDDGIFENVLLSTVPEPSSIVAICGLGAMGLLIAVRRRSKK
jgi:hypothetical protein